MSDIAARLSAVRGRIAMACARAGRETTDVRLIAVSKRHPVDAIRAAYAAGQREFGENYVQELVRKAEQLHDLPDVRMRLIGRLQRNKVKDVVRVHARIDTIDSVRVAEALDERACAAGLMLEVLVQVNIGEEPQKAGVAPRELAALCAAVGDLPGLTLRGFLAIPPASGDSEQSRPYFRRMRELADEHGVHELSMGMSDDLEVAVEEGATMVRVGAAIFGARSG